MKRSKKLLTCSLLICVLLFSFILGGCPDKNTIDTPKDNKRELYGVEGFAKGFVSIPDLTPGDAGYYIANDEKEFLQALEATNTETTSAAKIIEITADLNLGYKEVIQKYGNIFSTKVFASHRAPSLHPILLETGVSTVKINGRSSKHASYGEGLMIFSKNGATIKHASFLVENSDNIIFRNLRFDELWEWDETGNYDDKDWDYFCVDNVTGIWFDHLEFGKSYDGIIDFKDGGDGRDQKSVRNATFSYLKLNFQPNEFVSAQIEAIKNTSNKIKAMLNSNMTFDDVVKVLSFQKKGFLLGGEEFKYNKTTLTIYNSVVKNLQDRFPRLRGDRNNTPEGKGGDVHIFNCYYDATDVYDAKNKAASMWPILGQESHKSLVTNQAVVSTEGGAVGVENTIFKGVNDVIKTNQKSGQDNYTGKYQFINCRYELSGKVYTGSYTDGGSVAFPKNPFMPNEAAKNPTLDFSWNSFETIPYEYENLLKDVLIDSATGISELEEFLDSIIIGCDASGVIDWLNHQNQLL